MSNSEMPLSSAPVVPLNEEQRLLSLQSCGLLDTPPEPEFDALVRIAAHAFKAPIATIGLMDARRLWFKARVGLDETELDRSWAPCGHALLHPHAPLVIEDLAQDSRFARHPLVTRAPHLRFYAGAPLFDAQGLVLGTLAVMDTAPRRFDECDIAALRDMARVVIDRLASRSLVTHLRHLAMTDPLTGLSNRTQFRHALEVELAHAMRTGEPFTVLSMDLDGFKDVNDGFGRAAGEEVLCEVARRLTQQVRLGDVLARFGSDEFGVVMRHGAKDSAQVLAKRMVKAVSAPITLSSGDEIGVGISVGMAAYTDRVESVAMLLAQADQALYQAKKQNEKRWKMFVGIR